MNANTERSELATVVETRQRIELDDLDYKRALLQAFRRGATQVQLAAALKITQPSVSVALKSAQKVPAIAEGFSGATPLEICKRYAAGQLEREQLVDQLTRFPYTESGHTDGYDTLIVDPPGTWAEVDQAADAGLIDEDVYEDVFNRRHPSG